MAEPDGRRDLIQLRRDTTTDWEAVDPVLDYGEPGAVLDGGVIVALVIGDGVTPYSSLGQFLVGGGAAPSGPAGGDLTGTYPNPTIGNAPLADLKSRWSPASASAAASLDLREDTDNGTSRVRLIAPAALGADRTLTLPDADGTVATLTDVATKQDASTALTDLSSRWSPASASGPASLDLREDSDNGTSRARIIAPSSLSADVTLTLPSADGTLTTVEATATTLLGYALLAGRAGGQSLIGGTASGNDLTLTSTSHATLGLININSGTKYYAADQTFTAQPNRPIDIANTYTLSFTNAAFGGGALGTAKGVINLSPTLITTSNNTNIGSTGLMFRPTLKNSPGSGVTQLGMLSAVQSRPTYTADTDAITIGSAAEFYSAPTFGITAGGTLSITTDYVHFEAFPTLTDAGVSITQWAAFAMLAPTGSGTITNQAGLRLQLGTKGGTSSYGVQVGTAAWGGGGTNIGVYVHTAPTGGTTNTGIHNAGTMRQLGKATFGSNTEPTYGIHLIGTAQDVGAIHLPEAASTPTNPASSAGVVVYSKTDAIVFAFNDGGTMRYKSLTLSGTGVTWVHSTTPP